MMKEKIRALIVDDEPKARRRAWRLLTADPEIEIISECANGQDAIAAIQAHNPHLVLLDVVMPQIDGFEVLKAIDKEKMPLVIFITGHDEYAARSYEVHAVDYLSKPYSDVRFHEAIRKAKHRLRTEHIDEITASIFALLKDNKKTVPYLKHVPVKRDGSILLVKVTDITWIKAEDKYVCLHTGRAAHLLREAISNLEAQLDPEQFVRIDRSYIVSIDHIDNIIQMSRNKYEVVFRDGTKLKISRTGSERLRKIFDREC